MARAERRWPVCGVWLLGIRDDLAMLHYIGMCARDGRRIKASKDSIVRSRRISKLLYLWACRTEDTQTRQSSTGSNPSNLPIAGKSPSLLLHHENKQLPGTGKHKWK